MSSLQQQNQQPEQSPSLQQLSSSSPVLRRRPNRSSPATTNTTTTTENATTTTTSTTTQWPAQYAAGLRVPNLLRSGQAQQYGHVYKLHIPLAFTLLLPQVVQWWLLENVVDNNIMTNNATTIPVDNNDDNNNNSSNTSSFAFLRRLVQRLLRFLLASWLLPHWKPRFLILVGRYLYKFDSNEFNDQEMDDNDDDNDNGGVVQDGVIKSHDAVDSILHPRRRRLRKQQPPNTTFQPPKGRPIPLETAELYLVSGSGLLSSSLDSNNNTNDDNHDAHERSFPIQMSSTRRTATRDREDWVAMVMPRPPMREAGDQTTNVGNRTGAAAVAAVVFAVSTWSKTAYYAAPTLTDAQAWLVSLRQAQSEARKRIMGHAPTDSYPPAWQYFDRLGDQFIQTQDRLDQRRHGLSPFQWSSESSHHHHDAVLMAPSSHSPYYYG